MNYTCIARVTLKTLTLTLFWPHQSRRLPNLNLWILQSQPQYVLSNLSRKLQRPFSMENQKLQPRFLRT